VKNPDNKRKRASETGIVLGVVFVIMGFAYGNTGVWMLGFILLGIGAFARTRIGGKNE